jgi:hypothetical protein
LVNEHAPGRETGLPPTFVKVVAQVPPETASLATWKVFPVLLKLML